MNLKSYFTHGSQHTRSYAISGTSGMRVPYSSLQANNLQQSHKHNTIYGMFYILYPSLGTCLRSTFTTIHFGAPLQDTRTPLHIIMLIDIVCDTLPIMPCPFCLSVRYLHFMYTPLCALRSPFEFNNFARRPTQYKHNEYFAFRCNGKRFISLVCVAVRRIRHNE